MANITVPAYAIIDVEDKRDVHIKFTVEGCNYQKTKKQQQMNMQYHGQNGMKLITEA